MSAFAFFSSSTTVNSSPVVEDDTVLAAFGSVKSDYSQRQLAPGDHYITANSFFGSTTIIVPADAAVVAENFALFGVISDSKTAIDPSSARVRIHIRGLAFCGSVSIKRRMGQNTMALLEERDELPAEGPTSRLTVRDE